MIPRNFLFLSHLDFNLLRFRLPIMQRLIAEGHRVYAVCPNGQVSDKFKEFGIIHINWNLIRDNKNPFHEISIVKQLTRIYNDIDPDLVHAFTIRPNLYGSFAAFRNAFHFKIVNSVTGMGSLYNQRNSLKAKCIPYFVNITYKCAFFKSNAVIFQNNDDKNYFIHRRIVATEKAQLIRGSGVNTDLFQPHKDKTNLKNILIQNRDAIVVLFVARLIREKGVLDFCQAARVLKEKYKDNVHFAVIGDIDRGNPSHLSWDDLNEFRQSEIVQFTGHMDEPQPYFAASDIYCLPSYREGLPVTVMEAMASGLPVVTTDAPGCRETIDEGVSGFLVPVRDVDSLVDRLDRLIRDPALCERMGRAGREKAVREFSVEKIVDQHLALYEEILYQDISS